MKFKKFIPETEMINGDRFNIIPAHEGSVLLQRRKEMKMTQQQVADAAGIQLRQYQRVESGERSFSGGSARIMLSICEALKLDPYLFFGKGNENTEEGELHETYVILPKVENNGMSYHIPPHAYYLLISAIPYGMLCTEEEVWDVLKTAYMIDDTEMRPDHNSVNLYAEEAFPYWRVVSTNGYLMGSMFASKDKQKKLLEAEGHNIRKIGENEKYRVMDFQDTHFDMKKLKIFVMKTDKQILDSLNK